MIQAEELLELALKKAIIDVEIYQIDSFSRPISLESNRLKQIESSQTNGVAIRLWKDNKPGLAVAYGDFDPEMLIAKALAISELNQAQEILLNSDHKLVYSSPHSSANIPQLIEQGKKTIATIKEKYPEVIINLELEWEQEKTTLINSRGLYCQQTDTSHSASLGVEIVKDEDFLGIYDGEYTNETLQLNSIIERVLQKLAWAEDKVAIESQKLPILFTPNAAVTLWETISEAMNGKYIFDQSSPWSESIGKQVISSNLSLRQQPDLEPYACPFDDEGSVTQHLNLIKQGVLTNIYSDQKTALDLKQAGTGNGFRPSLSSYPTPDLINLVINEGNLSFTQLISELSEGIIIDQILGERGDISGDFSVNIDLGYQVKNGAVIGRVKDAMLAGNIYQALQQVVNVGNDRQWSGSCYTPSIIVDRLSVIANN